MRRFLLMVTLLVFAAPLSAQGIRMTPDFLPLEVGNVWRYAVTGPDGATLDEFTMEIRQHTIVEGKSLYVFTQFPLAPGIEGGVPVGVRYDRNLRQYKRFDGQLEEDLFPSAGASTEVLERDANGLPLRVVFDFSPGRLTLERGVGIVGAESGPQVIKLVGARVGSVAIGEVVPESAGPQETARPDYRDNVVGITEANPMVEVEAVADEAGHRFLLRVRNTSDKLLPFDFSSSQSFDFVVVDPQNGQEIWRWSRRMFFSRVIRSEAIRARGEWVFEAVWNHRDDNLDVVKQGTYEVFAILTAESPIESEAFEIEVP